MRRRHGFSLVELLVVLVIAAMLAALAVPMHGRYTLRARRIEGKQMLWRIAQAQERHYATYGRYGGWAELGFAEPAWSEQRHYRASLRLGEGDRPQSFVATAWPVSMQAKDLCGALAIDDAGRKTPGVADIAANGNGACW
ncbi:prepilin-type N-terminal cleavage/methylation domain-containing protein [Dyella sp. LX-66]|uniref:type IV pilin protein n=1 Tax=unclassified Dyella TaxID=2634549 RepID=UPI001BDFBAA8|nr:MULTISPECIES: type IV pilin protein [unclassified Dyella]MBT2118136.1 prepilin-type N-terminal cleavage/methylation domain-containing protein [Dyella sp. LX-1]MBT2138838.1 prepilin-type N-terminal cleavage/methylation domain-containing protein [Dyella sp. LX-66]